MRFGVVGEPKLIDLFDDFLPGLFIAGWNLRELTAVNGTEVNAVNTVSSSGLRVGGGVGHFGELGVSNILAGNMYSSSS